MSKDKKENQKLENSKTTRKIKTKWTIDLLNTSDIGYPEYEYHSKNEKED